MAGSVPLINYPWIERYAPLRDQEHVLLYSPEQGHLTQVIRQALADREGLRRMAQAGREHVCRYHTYQALRDYLLAETLQMDKNWASRSKG
jgi:spore maturation protein CgeB